MANCSILREIDDQDGRESPLCNCSCCRSVDEASPCCCCCCCFPCYCWHSWCRSCNSRHIFQLLLYLAIFLIVRRPTPSVRRFVPFCRSHKRRKSLILDLIYKYMHVQFSPATSAAHEYAWATRMVQFLFRVFLPLFYPFFISHS